MTTCRISPFSSGLVTVVAAVLASLALTVPPASASDAQLGWTVAPAPSQHVSGEVSVGVVASGVLPGGAGLAEAVSAVALYVDQGGSSRLIGLSSSPEEMFLLDTRDLADGVATLRARAYFGDSGALVRSRQIVIDNTAPLVAFAQPLANTHHAGWLTIQPDVSDVNLRRVDLYVDAERVASVSSAPWHLAVDTRRFDDGPVTFRLRAHDVAGNVSVVSRQAAVANGAVAASIVWPNPGRHVRGEVGVSTTFSGPAPVAETALLVDGVVVRSFPYLPAIVSWDSDTHGEGRRELQLRVTDRAGRVTFSPVRVVELVRTPPNVQVVSPRPGGSVLLGGAVTAEVSSTAGVRRVELWWGQVLVEQRLLGVPLTSGQVVFQLPEAVPADAAGIEVGSPQLFRVVMVDVLGNRGVLGRVATVIPPAAEEPDVGGGLFPAVVRPMYQSAFLAARDAAALEVGVEPDDVQFVSFGTGMWPDLNLGCAEFPQGRFPVPTEGYQFVFEAAAQTLHFHGRVSPSVTASHLCLSPQVLLAAVTQAWDASLPVPDSVPESLADAFIEARWRAARTTGIDERDLSLVSTDLVDWPNPWLGCSAQLGDPDIFPPTVMVEGYRVVLSYGGALMRFHGQFGTFSGVAGPPFLCANPDHIPYLDGP